MKITIELNTNDIVSAKAEHLNQALAAMQILAADSIETERRQPRAFRQDRSPYQPSPLSKSPPTRRRLKLRSL